MVVVFALVLVGCGSNDSPAPPEPTSGPELLRGAVGEPTIPEQLDLSIDERVDVENVVQDLVAAARMRDCDGAWARLDLAAMRPWVSKSTFCEQTLPALADVPLETGTVRRDVGMLWVKMPLGTSFIVKDAGTGRPRAVPVPFIPSSATYPFALDTVDSSGRTFWCHVLFLEAMLDTARGEMADRLRALPYVTRSGSVNLSGNHPDLLHTHNGDLRVLLPPAVSEAVEAMTYPDPAMQYALPDQYRTFHD